MKHRTIVLLLLVCVVWTSVNLQGVAAYSNSDTPGYPYSDHGAGAGCTSDAYPYDNYGYVVAHVNAIGFPSNGWALLGARDNINGNHYLTITATVRIYAYISTNIFGHGQIDVNVLILNADTHTILWEHCAWTSGDIGPSNHKSYINFQPTISATTNDVYGGNLLICVKFVAGGAYGTLIGYTSKDTTSSARMYIDQISWSY
ncbi:MAG: hypothetical protein K9W43_06320 [Candidatus Thorarchaeota archaeon]|nr:hypothetical protein [Candidatus Thorarchaeota archaeon]